MATIPEGMSADHFDLIFTHWQESLTIYRFNNLTTNISGQIDKDSYSDGDSVNGVLVKREQNYAFTKEGFVEQGDAYILLKYSDNSSNPPEKNDKIERSDGEKFIINDIINRRNLYYYCKLDKVN